MGEHLRSGDLRRVSPTGEPRSGENVALAAGKRGEERAMSVTAVEFALTDLLTRAGARIRGRRADCPRCKRRRSVSFDESRGVYHCHGAGCDFSGWVVKLAREQGLARPLSHAERQRLHRDWERADRAARALYQRTKARRFELLEELQRLNHLELQAHEAGPDHPATWGALALLYGEEPAVLAELAILENRGAADLIRFLTADGAARESEIAGVIEHGGL